MTKLHRIAVALLALAGGLPGQRIFHTVDQALRLAFPRAEVERTSAVLSVAERSAIAERAGTSRPRGLVFPYIARRDGVVVGTAYFDTHRVRTLRETVMVVVRPDGRIARVVLCAFGEPPDYVARDSFYAQFVRRRLDDGLRLRRGIDGVTGATLTCRATTGCARRVLAIHAVLAARDAPDQEETPPKSEGRR